MKAEPLFFNSLKKLKRHVRADNTFSFKSLRYEPPHHLASRNIQIRYERSDPRTRVIVYYKGERIGEAYPLDPVANDRHNRRTEETN